MGYLRKTLNFISFGSVDRSDAKKITNSSNERRDDAKEELDDAKVKTKTDFDNLGILKENVYSNDIGDFVKVFEVINKTSLEPLKKSEVLDYKKFKTDFNEMKVITTNIKEVSLTVAGGTLIGSTTAAGVIGFGTLFGSASTGTALGTLSGAAWTNGTLAWIGGGSISAGGAGVTGGMVVLGGIALAPVLIFGMFIGTNKGKQALNEASNYSDETDVLVEKVKTLIAELAQMRRGCYLMSESIEGLSALLKIHNIKMEKIAYRLKQRSFISKFLIDPIKNKIFSIDILSNNENDIFRDSANIAYMLSEIIKTPLMDEEGAFISNSLEVLEDHKSKIPESALSLTCQG